MGLIKFPFTDMQQLNLDWIMQQLHKILKFMPLDGVAGDVLQRSADGAAWQPLTSATLDIHGLYTIGGDVAANDELPIYDTSTQFNVKTSVSDLMKQAPVQSVNGQTGDVVLSIPAVPVTSVNGQTGDVVLSIPSDTSDLVNDSGFVDAAGAAAAAPVQSVAGKTGTVTLDKSDVGLGNVDNVQQYSVSNPPPYPVTSVNGQTGDVVIGGGSGCDAQLLWTNSAPASSFAAQTLALDLTDYSFILIEFCAGYYVGEIKTCLFPVPTLPPPTGYTSKNVLDGIFQDGTTVEPAWRKFEITSASIVFDGGVKVSAIGTSGTTANDSYVCKPLRIWGIA